MCTPTLFGYDNALEKKYIRYDVVETIENALEPHRPRRFTIAAQGGGFLLRYVMPYVVASAGSCFTEWPDRALSTGYQTAWTMLHRFRRAMVRPGREQLKGLVEVDQSYLAIRENRETPSGKPSKKRTTKALIVIAVEILEPRGFGRIRLKRIDRERVADVLPFVKSVVAPGSVIRTDGSPMYFSLEHHYAHDRLVVKSIADGERPPAHVPLPGVHRVASLLKRWLLGTHQGAVKPDQLDHYLDEFVFRFNRRTSRSRGLLFYRLLEQALATAPITYDNVVVNKSRRKGHQPPRCEIVELNG